MGLSDYTSKIGRSRLHLVAIHFLLIFHQVFEEKLQEEKKKLAEKQKAVRCYPSLCCIYCWLATCSSVVVVLLAVPFLERLDVLGFTGKAEKERLEHELKSKMLGGSIFKSCQYMLVPCLLVFCLGQRMGMVFADIFILSHLAWLMRVCELFLRSPFFQVCFQRFSYTSDILSDRSCRHHIRGNWRNRSTSWRLASYPSLWVETSIHGKTHEMQIPNFHGHSPCGGSASPGSSPRGIHSEGVAWQQVMGWTLHGVWGYWYTGKFSGKQVGLFD